MHRNHPAGFEIKECLHGIGGVGVNVAELRRIVSADGQQSEFGSEAASDFAEAGKVGSIACVIDRVFARLQDEASVAAMRIFQDPRAPVTRRNVRDRQISVARGLPPIELDDLGKAKVGDQVGDMSGNDDRRRDASLAQVILHNRAQRWPMQMIEVRVRNQHQIDGRQVGNAQARGAADV